MIELRAGRLRCELHPDLGGSIAGFWFDGQPVLRSTPAARAEASCAAGCHPLVPFSNRVVHASVVWQGTQQPTVRNAGDDPGAIQGMVAQRAWSVLDSDATSAMLACEHPADPSWPFAFDCSHTLRLTPQALEMTLAVTNQSAQPAPMGLGWRPWFVKHPGSHLAFRAGSRWELDADKLPAARGASQGLDQDCAALAADDCFDGWDGRAELRDATLRVRVESGLTRLVVASDPARGDLALEPVSHVPNAVHLHAAGLPTGELGLSLLQPGESMMAQMRIVVEPVA